MATEIQFSSIQFNCSLSSSARFVHRDRRPAASDPAGRALRHLPLHGRHVPQRHPADGADDAAAHASKVPPRPHLRAQGIGQSAAMTETHQRLQSTQCWLETPICVFVCFLPFLCRPGANAADAPVHLHPAGVPGDAVGRHVHAGVAGLPLLAHHDRPRQDVPAAAHLHLPGDGLRESATAGRPRLALFCGG